MAEPLCDQIMQKIKQAAELYHRLLLVVAPASAGKTSALQDVKERMARLLTLLFLYQAGFEVGRYISLEHLIENQREGYYDAHYKSSQGRHEGKHTLLP